MTTTKQNFEFEEIVADPYSWKFPNRSQLMSLQTINQKDVGFPKLEYKDMKLRTRNFDVTDIDGAKTEVKGYKYYHKETFVNKIEDIDGTSPKKPVYYQNKPDYQLYNKDIKGSQPQINKFQTTRQAFNPLQPVYKLPSCQIRVATPPKFIRDNIQIDDIQGTKPNQRCFKQRNVDIYTEIEGSRSKKLFIPRDHKDFLEVKDINEFLQFVSKRQTNPLEPTYVTSDEQGVKFEFGSIDGSKSRRLHPKDSRKVNFSLTTNDIRGAWHGTISEKFLRRQERKDFRNTNLTQDIKETQVGSLKKGIVTIRQTNPLIPKYQLLGEQEGLKNYEAYINPIKEQSIVNASRINQQAFKNKSQIVNNNSNLAVSNLVSQVQNIPQQENQKPNLPQSNSQSQFNGKKRSSIQSQKSVVSNQDLGTLNLNNLPKVLGVGDIEQQNEKDIKAIKNSKEEFNLQSRVGYPLSTAQKFDKYIDQSQR